MENCVFCLIVKSKLPCYKVYEDENFLAFLDIFPATSGHTLVIPKKHYQWVYDVPNFSSYWKAVLRVTRLIQKKLKPVFITYLTFGLHVPHAHIHILPRFSFDNQVAFPSQKRGDEQELKKISQLLSR